MVGSLLALLQSNDFLGREGFRLELQNEQHIQIDLSKAKQILSKDNVDAEVKPGLAECSFPQLLRGKDSTGRTPRSLP